MARKTAARPALRETRIADAPPLYAQGAWWARFPWLFQATTGRGDDDAYDFRLFGSTPSGTVIDRWLELRRTSGFARAVHARQVHGSDILAHEDTTQGLLISERMDGHVTRTPGILLAVSVADCVPVSIVAADTRAIALLHAGWRGSAAGILEAGIERLRTEYGTRPGELHVHFGPANLRQVLRSRPRGLYRARPRCARCSRSDRLARGARAARGNCWRQQGERECLRLVHALRRRLLFAPRWPRSPPGRSARHSRLTMVHPGLCASCINARIVETRTGSRFYLCELSKVDPRFPKYPPLPVVRCDGYTPAVVEPPPQ